MREFQEKRRREKRIYSPLVIAGLVILTLVMAKASWNVLWKKAESERKYNEAREALQKLDAREAMLLKSIEELETETGREKEIREKFRMTKEGEELIIVLDENRQPATSPQEEGVWSRVKSMFR